MYTEIKMVHSVSNNLITSCPGLLTVSGKVVPMCCMKVSGGVVLQFRSFFLNVELVGCEWLASRPDRFTFGDSGPGVHRVEGCAGRKLSGPYEEEKKRLHLLRIEPRFLISLKPAVRSVPISILSAKAQR
jgi:hypothetical protein